MPELPEVEAARALAERWSVGRTILAVDDSDEWVCRPHPPGEIAAAVVGRRIEAAGRQGKSMWLALDDGHRLGIHLGMAGRLVGLPGSEPGGDDVALVSPGGPGDLPVGAGNRADAGDDASADRGSSAARHGEVAGKPTEGDRAFEDAGAWGVTRLDETIAARHGLPDAAGEPFSKAEVATWSAPVRTGVRELPGDGSWTRLALDLDDGGRLLLFDKRRLARVRLDPDLSHLGPDALEVDDETFADRVGRGTAPLKARLMDQSTVAGIGNLLCDEVLWQAEQPPLRPAGDLSHDELLALHGVVIEATRTAMRLGGVHKGAVIEHRRKGEHCPRCGAEMVKDTVGGRTTWWCSFEQSWPPDADE